MAPVVPVLVPQVVGVGTGSSQSGNDAAVILLAVLPNHVLNVAHARVAGYRKVGDAGISGVSVENGIGAAY